LNINHNKWLTTITIILGCIGCMCMLFYSGELAVSNDNIINQRSIFL